MLNTTNAQEYLFLKFYPTSPIGYWRWCLVQFLMFIFFSINFAEARVSVSTDPEWPMELVKIEKIKYERNTHASFCQRPTEMIDTIVFHHSETPSTTTAEWINELHLSRGTPEDPWYMIAYSYTVNSPYKGLGVPSVRVVEGRPLGLVGAHAGTNAFAPMNEEQKELWEQGKITCGKENQDFQVNPRLVKGGQIKANVTTIGIVIIGNYAPFSKTNPSGYSPESPRYPTDDTQDILARLSCQLQKKHKRIRHLKWHNFYHPTTCPGTIREYVNSVRTIARKYGCEFD
jgi:hypothetical protein